MLSLQESHARRSGRNAYIMQSLWRVRWQYLLIFPVRCNRCISINTHICIIWLYVDRYNYLQWLRITHLMEYTLKAEIKYRLSSPKWNECLSNTFKTQPPVITGRCRTSSPAWYHLFFNKEQQTWHTFDRLHWFSPCKRSCSLTLSPQKPITMTLSRRFSQWKDEALIRARAGSVWPQRPEAELFCPLQLGMGAIKVQFWLCMTEKCSYLMPRLSILRFFSFLYLWLQMALCLGQFCGTLAQEGCGVSHRENMYKISLPRNENSTLVSQ